MSYLIVQIFICLIIAAVIGFIIGWLWKTYSCKKQHKTSATQNRTAMQSSIQELTDENRSLQENLKQARNTIQQKDAEIKNLQKQLQACNEENKKSTAQLQTKIQDNEMKLQQAQQNITLLQQEKESVENQLQQSHKKIEALKQEKEEAEQNIAELASIIEELKTKLKKESQLTLLQEPRNGQKDNLQLIKGIGPVLEKILNEIGIYHFDQIASLKEEDIAFINEKLAFSGRIERDDWVTQAKALAKGIDTEFSQRVKEGKVPTSRSS